MSENRMVASTSSRRDSADGDASTRSATSGGRKEASALANRARSFIRSKRTPSPVWAARSVISFSLAGVRLAARWSQSARPAAPPHVRPEMSDCQAASPPSSVPGCGGRARSAGRRAAWRPTGLRLCSSPSRSHTITRSAPVASTTKCAICCRESSEAPAMPRENSESTS